MDTNYKLTGRHIGVAILDTGIFPHVDFEDRIVVFKDFIHHRRTPYDDNGHGTHVAGIIGGAGIASKGRYCGVAPACDLIALKVLDQDGNGSKAHVLKALEWIRENRENYNIRIINISVGTTQKVNDEHKDLIEGVEAAWDDGFIVVTAAGNMGPHPGTITAPGSSKKVITVGSSDMLTRHQGISGRGPTSQCICKPDIVAPGNSIISCSSKLDRRSYTVKSGTSMSTPMISGAIALLLEKYPAMSNLEIKYRLKETARDLGYTHNIQGWGSFSIHDFLAS